MRQTQATVGVYFTVGALFCSGSGHSLASNPPVPHGLEFFLMFLINDINPQWNCNVRCDKQIA